jgi:hypothetical protein
MVQVSKVVSRTAVTLVILGLAGCANMDSTEQRTLSGGAAGAVIGTVGTVVTGGCVPCGAAIGGAVGAGTGYVIDQVDKSHHSN